MRWLHGFLNDIEQVLTQLAQVYLIEQGCAERFHDLDRSVLTAVETAVNDRLDAMAQGLEESSNSECRDYAGDIVILAYDPSQQVLQGKDETKIDHSQQDRQRAIHERTVDQQVDVVESVPQNREPNGERDQEKYDGEEEIKHDSKTFYTQSILVLERG